MLDPRQIAPETPRLISRWEFMRMAETGMFEGERVELLDGVVVSMTPQKPRHAGAVERLTRVLVLAVHSRARVRIQIPFAASDLSQPEPDVTVVPHGDPDIDHPDRAYLVVEVAESSLAKDGGYKAALYARSRVDEYWVVDVVDRRILVHRDPTGDGYATVTEHARGDIRTVAAFPDVEIPVSDIVP